MNASSKGFGGAFSAADCLSLAAAPTFATMALLEAAGGGPLSMLCSSSPLSGMLPMYLLMAAFHLGPWLRLIYRRSSSLEEADPAPGDQHREPERH
jgi:hypothetical protein